jgi:hypothetical protein
LENPVVKIVKIAKVLLVAVAAAFWATGCEFTTADNLGTVGLNELNGITPATPTNPTTPSDPASPTPSDPVALPDNPQVSGRGQQWYFGYKSYDNTFRIRWPTYFATSLGVGSGSYTLVDGQVAGFRGYDTDNNSKRPSYTTPGPKSRFSGVVTCVLYSSSGQALGWFKADAGGTSQGNLP